MIFGYMTTPADEPAKKPEEAESQTKTFSPDQIESVVLQNPPLFSADISDLDWLKDNLGPLASNERFVGRDVFCDNFCVYSLHPVSDIARSAKGHQQTSESALAEDRKKLIRATEDSYGSIKFDIKALEKKTPVGGYYYQKYKIAICNVELRLPELKRFIEEILRYDNFYIADLDLTMDVAGHLDYEACKTEFPRIDDRIGKYTETKYCGS